MIHKKMELFGERLSGQLANHGIAEIRKNFLAMTTDTLYGHVFDSSLELLEDNNTVLEWQRTIKVITILTPLQKQFT